MMKNFLLNFFGLLFLINFNLEAKIRILTFHYNRPDFIEYQKRCLDKFLKERDDYELLVFNDASNENIALKIEEACDKYSIRCIRYDQSWHHNSPLLDNIKKWAKNSNLTGFEQLGLLLDKHPSTRHCNVIQYALDRYGYDHDDIVALMDGDMFLIKPTSIRNLLKKHSIIGTLKMDQTESVSFFWVALTFFDVTKLPDKHSLKFHLTCINNHVTDSGGHSYFYLKEHPSVPTLKILKEDIESFNIYTNKKLKSMKFRDEEIQLIRSRTCGAEFHMHRHFLHYLRSSFVETDNAFAPETSQFHYEKTCPIFSFLEKILEK